MIWLMITAGRGPAECEVATAKVFETLNAEAIQAGVSLVKIHGESTKNGFSSVLVEISGGGEKELAERWMGTIQWICESSIRPGHKRKNWFVAVEQVEPQQELAAIREEDLVWQAMRASGAGGQHVNRTESAIRLTHKPSGISVIAMDERSQHRNRAIAIKRLATALDRFGIDSNRKKEKQAWGAHNELERGNAKLCFVGTGFKPK